MDCTLTVLELSSQYELDCNLCHTGLQLAAIIILPSGSFLPRPSTMENGQGKLCVIVQAALFGGDMATTRLRWLIEGDPDVLPGRSSHGYSAAHDG